MNAHAFSTSSEANVLPGGEARFRLWAPVEETVVLIGEPGGSRLPMPRDDEGWFELETDAAPIGGGYLFDVGGSAVPDPAARAQIGDVHGPSRLVDHRAFPWRHSDWRGRPWEETIIYELHTGTFTPSGTFSGIEQKLDHLASLDVIAIELMPVAQFGGTRGWGYDGVLLYAPHLGYGGPEGLKHLIDAAHERGLMVLLDVVYNRFGPDGNYLHLYAPDFFHPERKTPWGTAIAHDKAPVRRFFIENALYWLEEFRFDGLRLNAIDQIDDAAETPLLEELAAEVRRTITDRHIHLTTEDDHNIARLHQRVEVGVPRLYTGAWNDDFHHAAHVAATGEREGCYADYGSDAVDLARALAEGFIYQGQPSPFRDGAERGEPCGALPPCTFIDFLQNHDQIGNRAFGERLTTLGDAKTLELLTALLILSPHTPLIFMGEEWAEQRPFFYFTDFSGALAVAVRDGRCAEFRKWPQFADPANRQKIPVPNALATMECSRIDWPLRSTQAGSMRLELMRKLLHLRLQELVPRLHGTKGAAISYRMLSPRAFEVSWLLGDGATLRPLANFGVQEVAVPPANEEAWCKLYESAPGLGDSLAAGRLPYASIVFSLKEATQ